MKSGWSWQGRYKENHCTPQLSYHDSQREMYCSLAHQLHATFNTDVREERTSLLTVVLAFHTVIFLFSCPEREFCSILLSDLSALFCFDLTGWWGLVSLSIMPMQPQLCISFSCLHLLYSLKYSLWCKHYYICYHVSCFIMSSKVHGPCVYEALVMRHWYCMYLIIDFINPVIALVDQQLAQPIRNVSVCSEYCAWLILYMHYTAWSCQAVLHSMLKSLK